MRIINHDTILVPGEMLLILKVFLQAYRGLPVTKNMKNFKISQKTLKVCFYANFGALVSFFCRKNGKNNIFSCSNCSFSLMHVCGHMIGQAHTCPGKCHKDKSLHIHSCPLRVVDFESLTPPPSRCRTYIVDQAATTVNDNADLFDLVWYFRKI